MKISCVYKPTIHDRDGKEKFEAIQKHFGWSDAITEIKIGTWQGENDNYRFPTVSEMIEYERNHVYKSQEKISNGVQNTTLQAMLGTEIEKEVSLNEIIDTFLIGSPYEALIKTYRDDIALKDVKVNLTRDTNGGKYDSGSRRITLGANTFFNNGSPASIMMHEIMHALTVDRINKYPEYKKRFKAILDEYRKKNDVFAHQYYQDAHTHKTFDEDTAIKEFIADCWTNPRTIKELNNIVADKKTNRTLWDKIKSLFNDIFKAKEGSLLETAAIGITDLLNETLTSRDFTDHDTYGSQEISQEQKINTHQESTPVDLSLDHKMRQTWTPQVIQNRGIRISQIFKDIVTDLENKLPEIEKLNTSSATRKYIITVKNGTGNILSKVKDTIKQHYANVDWVTEQIHNIYDESDWDSQEIKDKIDYIVNQGNLMLEFFEPLCYVASSEIKRQEGVSILTSDGEVIDLSEEENFTDEEIQQKHEEGWYYNPNEQSVEETLRSETVSMLSNLYEVDSDGQYIKFDDLEEPLPIDFRMALATLLKTVGNCNSDTQMLPALQLASQKYPWMKQIIDNLLGRDTATSSLYDGLSEEDRRLKAFSLQATFWRDMHKILVNISEQKRVEDKNNPNQTNIECGVINRNEGADALMKIFEDVCYNNKTLFNEHGKPYKSVYNSDGTFNNNVYNQIHKEVNESGLYYRIPDMKVDANDINLIDRALKSFGVNIPKENISKLFDITQEITDKQKESAKALKDVIFGFYAPNKDSNTPLKTVIADNGVSNIFDEFNRNYKTISEIFSDESIGFEESQVRISVDNENKSLFSRIFPNLINTIVNKLKNTDNLSNEEYQARLQADYGKNWWFAPTVVNGKGIFRKGILKDLSENPAYRIGLRVTSLKASDEISYLHEIDAQAEETRLNQFENSNTPINGINFREYSVPTFSDAPESYFMRLPYFDIHDSKQRTELLDRLCDVARQEIDRINVVKARARMNEEAVQKGIEPPVKEIAGFDKYGNKFSFIPGLNENKDEFIEEFNRLNVNPEEQQRFLKSKIRECLEKEFDFYVDSFNSWQVTKLPTSRFKEKLDERKYIISFIDQTLALIKDIPLSSTARTIIDNIKNKLLNNTFTDNQFNELKDELKNVITSGLAENEWSRQVKERIDSFKIDTSVTERLKDYFYNTFYAETQIISLTMRDPAFLGTLDKFQKRYKMFYSPVETCYTCEYYYDENGNIALRDKKDSLGKQTEYSLVLQDDILAEAFSFDNIKSAIHQKVLGGYLTKPQAEEIINNFKGIVRSDAQCYRTLPSWQACLNMIGKGFDKKMQQSMNRLMNPDKYGQWSYEDYHNVWEIFKPFVASYAEKPSMVDTETEFNSQFENIETPIMHKNSEFLLLAMYSAMSGELQNNWKLKALNEFMVKHGIDKVQFESAVKVGIQSPININDCTTPEEVTSTLEAITGLRDNMQASEGDKQVITAIPFSSWGISTSMPEHLLEHEESSMGTQLMKIIMEGISEDPNKEVTVGDRTMTYKQWLELYQAIHVQNIKDDFAKVGKIFKDNDELATYLKKQILTQNKYSQDLIRHLELDTNGNFVNPIIDPMLRGQFDALLASLIRNRVTKRMTRLGALPQVASYGFDDLQLRFKDENGNLIRTQKEFEEEGSNIDGITTWEDYKKYINSHDLTIAHMEVLLPPFDNNFMTNINDVFIDKNGKFNHELFMQKIDKKLLEGIANRIPTETKHSMIPIYVKGFLPSQNSSCVVCPAEWIAISDSDNDGDKLYTYFYHSRVVWNTNLMKGDWAKHYKWNYINRTERERLVNEAHKYAIGKQKVSSSDMKKYESEDYKKSEELDIMFDQLSRLAGEKDLTQTLVLSSYDTENNKFDIHAITTFDTKSDREYDALKEFLRQAKLQARYIKTIEPIEFKTSEVERHEDESDSEYNHRVLMESIKDNTHEARNNMMLDLMNSILKTDENTAQILIPGGFPIIKKVSNEIKELTGVKDDACSICNPAVRTQQQVNNTAGKNLVGVYANHRSLRPLLEIADITVNANNRITINGNISLPKKAGLPTFSLSSIKNARNEYISDNVSNFSGASVDNAKDPRLKYLGQDEVSAPITMFLIHQGYTIEETAMFMCQPAVKQCIRQYIINGRKGSLLSIVLTEIESLKTQTENRTVGSDVLENLPLDTLKDQIKRDARGIIQNADDCAIQQVVLESLAKIIPASQALQSIISVVKSDTQIGALSPRSAENKIKLQMIDRLVSRINSGSFPLKGAEALIPDLYTSADVDNSNVPYVSAFRFFGVESIRVLSKDLSMTFMRLVDEVHDTALEKTDELNLDANTIDGLTNATASYLFSSIKQFDNKNTFKIVRRATRILNEIKQRRLIKDNALINDLTVNINGNRYSKRMAFIKLNRNNRKNIRGVEVYQNAWRSLIVNGANEIKLNDGTTITYKELSDMLFDYCFVVHGLTPGGNSFMYCYPTSELDKIEGYVDMVNRLSSYNRDSSVAESIVDQYVANNPQNYHLVHRINGKKFNTKDFLTKSRVVPQTIKITNFKGTEEFYKIETFGGQVIYKPYPYITFKDETGRRYLYKGSDMDGGIMYQRMQVLGNTESGYLEEYMLGGNVMFGFDGCMNSALMENSNMIVDKKLKNDLDANIQERISRGETLTQEDYLNTIRILLGGNEAKEKSTNDYTTQTKDRTGMEFCAIL